MPDDFLVWPKQTEVERGRGRERGITSVANSRLANDLPNVSNNYVPGHTKEYIM